MKNKATLQPGSLLMVDGGAYSDYRVDGFFVVLKEMNPCELLDEYLSAHPEETQRYNFDQQGFLAFIATSGYILEIRYNTLYLGEYGNHDTVELCALGGFQREPDTD